RISAVEFLPGPAHWACPCGHGILSFSVRGQSSADIGFILGTENICVRTGQHCMHERRLAEDSIRLSVQIYNTEEEIDRCVALLQQICKSL
ncbi:MAG: aminotransferase class V-fold PLP-dependent enzyme, partial [Deltaproteobacteria bacterium]|nr:aminotransferase class V-fold PLP-dependent enzyme [Deltaproteobacteria bacterium]